PAPAELPRVLALPQHAGLPRESRNDRGGKGGQSALQEQQEQKTSSCCLSGESRGTPAPWQSTRHRLAALGVYRPSKIAARIREEGGRPADLMALCDYYELNRDRLVMDAHDL